jgi:hypothetical protein
LALEKELWAKEKEQALIFHCIINILYSHKRDKMSRWRVGLEKEALAVRIYTYLFIISIYNLVPLHLIKKLVKKGVFNLVGWMKISSLIRFECRSLLVCFLYLKVSKGLKEGGSLNICTTSFFPLTLLVCVINPFILYNQINSLVRFTVSLCK